MARIPQADVEAVRARADIVEVISNYIPVDRKGREYAAVCPFHDDHDPSMRISPDKQIYKCFVCGAGGNVFTFVSKMEKISFPESVIKVAKMIGYPLQISTSAFTPKPSPYDPLYRIFREYFDYTSYELGSSEGAPAYQYLKSRRFTDELIEKFQLGYAPAASMQRQYIKAKNLSLPALTQTGLIRDTGQSDRTDGISPVFFNRIIIPIHDEHGNPVGITARAMPDDKETAKYINTSATALYEKGRLLFNYHRAKTAARKNGRLIIAEGAMDVMGLAKAGIEEAVAALGTAFTAEQMQLIRRLNVPVTVFYDSDAAGQKAAWKFGNAALQAGIRFGIVSQSSGKDPDELYCSGGKEAVLSAVEKTIPFAEFAMNYLQTEYRLENYEDKKKYASEVAGLIRKTMDQHEAPANYQKLAELTGFDYSTSESAQEERRQFARNQNRLKGKKKNQKALIAPVLPMENGRYRAEKSVLACMLASRQYADTFRDEIGYFRDETAQTLSLYIYQMYRQPDYSPERLMSDIEEDEVRNLLVDLIDEDPAISMEFFQDALLKIRESMITDQIESLNRQIQDHPEAAVRTELLARKQRLLVQKIELRNKKEDPEWKM